MKKIICFLALSCILFSGWSQVKIGTGLPGIVNPAAVLELSNNLDAAPSTWKTFLPPQVNFTNANFASATSWGVSGAPVIGAIVFNIGPAYNNGFTGPGLYWWSGEKWVGLSAANEDRVRTSLSTSTQAYDTASNNSWVMVTEGEYNSVLQLVAGAVKYAAPDSFMNLSMINGWNQIYTVGGNTTVSQIPPSNYIIAFSVRTGLPYNSSSLHSKIKISTSQLTGYTDYGNSLPDYTLTTDVRYYFILKKPPSPTPSQPCYTAVYNARPKFLGNRPVSPGRDFFATSDSPTLNNSNSTQSAVQFICTPLKQW